MRILQVIHDFLPIHQAGSELYCYHLSKALQRLGHEVYLFYSEIDHERVNYSVQKDNFDGLPFLEVVNNHNYHAFEETYFNPIIEDIFSQWLSEIQPDVVHFHHLWNLSYGCVHLCKQKQIPVVFTLHDYWLTCPRGGGQRFRGEGSICHSVDTSLCAECISRYSIPAAWGTRLVKKVLNSYERIQDQTLLTKMLNGRIETPQSHFVRRGLSTIAGDSRDTCFAHPPSKITFKTPVPSNANLKFAVAMDPSTYNKEGNGVVFRIRCNDTIIYERTLNAKSNREDRGWHDELIPLEKQEGKRCKFSFETDVHPPGNIDFCTANWAEPQIMNSHSEPYRPSLTNRFTSIAETMLTRMQKNRLKKKVDHRTLKTHELFKNVDCFIAPSQFLRTKFIEYGLPPDKIVFSDYGIVSDAYSTPDQIPQPPIRFSYIGTITEHKGLHVLVDAFNRLPLDSAILNVYGHLGEFTGYVKRIHSMISHPGIRLNGRVENKDIPHILAATDVLVIPSIWFENSPITIHEALLAQVPVITSRFGGMADLIRDGENGLLFEVGNSGELYKCLNKCIKNPELISTLRPNPSEVKSINDDAQWIVDLYKQLQNELQSMH